MLVEFVVIIAIVSAGLFVKHIDNQNEDKNESNDHI